MRQVVAVPLANGRGTRCGPRRGPPSTLEHSASQYPISGRDRRLRSASGDVATFDRLRVFAPRARHHRPVGVARESSRIPLRITRLPRDPLYPNTTGAAMPKRASQPMLRCPRCVPSKLRISPDGPALSSPA